DFNGEVLTLRESDNEILSFVAQMQFKEMVDYLKLNQLLFNRS
ncbi:MAG: hypothetical protein RL470_340, partial [Actinomycetota bacterium]